MITTAERTEPINTISFDERMKLKSPEKWCEERAGRTAIILGGNNNDEIMGMVSVRNLNEHHSGNKSYSIVVEDVGKSGGIKQIIEISVNVRDEDIQLVYEDDRRGFGKKHKDTHTTLIPLNSGNTAIEGMDDPTTEMYLRIIESFDASSFQGKTQEKEPNQAKDKEYTDPVAWGAGKDGTSALITRKENPRKIIGYISVSNDYEGGYLIQVREITPTGVNKTIEFEADPLSGNRTQVLYTYHPDSLHDREWEEKNVDMFYISPEGTFEDSREHKKAIRMFNNVLGRYDRSPFKCSSRPSEWGWKH